MTSPESNSGFKILETQEEVLEGKTPGVLANSVELVKVKIKNLFQLELILKVVANTNGFGNIELLEPCET